MSDEKKNDFAVELGEKGNGNFEPKERTTNSAASSPASQVSSQPMFAIFSYCGSSILMTVTNKYVLTGTFNLNFFLLAIQSVVCILAIQSLKVFGFAKFRDYNNEEARKWFPITLLLIGMIYTSSKALQYLSIPVYTIFKNLTTILIAYGEVIWFGGSVTSLALLSFGLMVLSSVIAAWADIGNALASYGDSAAGQAAVATLNSGYMWMMLNCFCTAAYLLSMRKRIKLTNFKDFDTMFYNNLLSIPVLLFASLFTENWSSANIDVNFPPSQRSWTVFIMLISGLSTVFISYSSAWCVRITSSTTYSMVGALNKLPIAISGLVFFDAPVTVASVSAIFVGFVSGLVYTLSKIWDKQKDNKSTVLPTTSASAQSVRDGHKS